MDLYIILALLDLVLVLTCFISIPALTSALIYCDRVRPDAQGFIHQNCWGDLVVLHTNHHILLHC